MNNFSRTLYRHVTRLKKSLLLVANSSSNAQTQVGNGKLAILFFGAGSICGLSLCLLNEKYPFLLMKIGVSKDAPESFIPQPDVIRADTVHVDRYLKICEAIIALAGQATLSTLDVTLSDDGEEKTVVKSRIVGSFPPLPSIPNIYFTTNKLSRKFQQIQKNPNVVLTYFDKDGQGSLIIDGHVEILSDGESTSMWQNLFFMFYPEGPVTEEKPESRFVVIKLIPKRMEFCSVRFNVETAHHSWLPGALTKTKDGTWEVDPQSKFL